MTSHDVVARCRRIFAQKRVGHAGTLDPDATGVLLVGLGRATRLMQFMSGLPKSYDTEIVLGAATSTLDASGEVTGEWDMDDVTLEQARSEAGRLTGELMQVPPMVSALKVGGQRLHALARAGVEVERAPRPVTVTRFEITAKSGSVLSATIDCSSGTYVRVLAADLGAALGGGAHVMSLRRTGVGPWQAEQAVALDALDAEAVLPPSECLPWLERVQVTGEVEGYVAHGRVLERSVLAPDGDGPWVVLDAAGAMLAVYQAHRDATAKPAVVLSAAG